MDKWFKKGFLQRNGRSKITLITPAQVTDVDMAALTLLLLLLRALCQPREDAKPSMNESDLRRAWPQKIKNDQEVCLKYGFTSTFVDDEPCLKHMSCLEIGAKDSMKLPPRADVPNQSTQNMQTNLHHVFSDVSSHVILSPRLYKTSLNLTTAASLQVSYSKAKTKKPRTLGETLVLPGGWCLPTALPQIRTNDHEFGSPHKLRSTLSPPTVITYGPEVLPHPRSAHYSSSSHPLWTASPPYLPTYLPTHLLTYWK